MADETSADNAPHNDELPAPVAMPAPPDWHALHPELVMALARAQALCTTVDNDGHNSHSGYDYATISAIACKVRKACEATGLYLCIPGYGMSRDRGTVVLRGWLMHPKGCTPAFEVEMPVPGSKDTRKSIAASVSLRPQISHGLPIQHGMVRRERRRRFGLHRAAHGQCES